MMRNPIHQHRQICCHKKPMTLNTPMLLLLSHIVWRKSAAPATLPRLKLADLLSQETDDPEHTDAADS